MAGAVKFDRDNGYTKVRKALAEDATSKLDVGLPNSAIELLYDNGVSVWEAAAWSEFGVAAKDGRGWRQPPRPWLRGWFDENKDLVVFWLRGEMQRVVRGEQTREQALENVGRRCVHGVKQRILSGIEPENAEATVRKKGFSLPLFNTGKFVKAIAYKVTRKG